MNSLRPELLELTPQALTALSNAGFVKRSLKELENGNVPEISHENYALIATFSDGVRTQLAATARHWQAQCSCGANGMCRHRVMLVLLSTTLCHHSVYGKRRRVGSGNLAGRTGYPARLPANAHRRWSLKASPLSCSVRRAKFPLRLPMSDARFYSRSSIRFARCDCIEGTLCEHVVLAVQAFVEAKTQ